MGEGIGNVVNLNNKIKWMVWHCYELVDVSIKEFSEGYSIMIGGCLVDKSSCKIISGYYAQIKKQKLN